ncbi:YisL family protein [Bacillus weihaiensis]|uniref:UPF0344 protein A9C19_15155 n=1 Tax=Bacillus weihaiensis TaxID=1547283 RepID=A0A1L3MUG6_9BACI|nr:YisL family protein [Bacillus weihaiensis]APH05964.1 hypothetical protein A9C19_15155 [Bacillus weihaiensis]
MVHAHITSWALGIILFFVAFSLFKSGKEKPFKIVHMVLRLVYVLIVITGIVVVTGVSQLSAEYIAKIVLGIWTIGAMEMVLVRSKKGKPTRVFWIQFIVVLIVTILLGVRLPLGLWSMY